jgi:ketosteroid isomerase-like protein
MYLQKIVVCIASLVVVVLMVVAVGCVEPNEYVGLSEAERSAVVNAVEAATWAFHAADTSRSAEGVLDLLWPEFSLLGDGNRSDYASVAEGATQFMSNVDTFHTVWDDLQIIAIGSTAAVSSFIFTDRITMNSGDVIESRGPNTFVWEKRDGVWKVIHTDADHYPKFDQ